MGPATDSGEHQVIARLLVGVAVAFGAAGWAAASVSADPNPFSTLSCACKETEPPGSPVLTEKIEQGIQYGLSSPDIMH